MATKDMDLECYWTNLELADKAIYEHLFWKTPMTKQLIYRLNNLKNRTDKDYDFAGKSQRSYDKWQIDILEEIIPIIESQWIPVTERLPENSNDILMKWRFWFVKTAIWRYHHTWENWFVLPNQIGFYKTETVTHWMPIPHLSPK
jgi:hypothetical protein